MTDNSPTLKHILAVALVSELTMLLDRIESYSSKEQRESFKSERLNLKRARAQLSKIIADLEPTTAKEN